MATLSEQLLARIRSHSRLPDIDSEAELHRMYPTSSEREAGAYVWIVSGTMIGSGFSMRECLASPEWVILGDQCTRFEIIPQE